MASEINENYEKMMSKKMIIILKSNLEVLWPARTIINSSHFLNHLKMDNLLKYSYRIDERNIKINNISIGSFSLAKSKTNWGE